MEHQIRRLLFFLALLAGGNIVLGCSGGGAPSPSGGQRTVSVSGAFALFPMMSVWTEEYQRIDPAIRFDVQAGGAGKGMTDVLAGAVDIAMLSREPRPEESAQGAVLIPVVVDAVVGTINAGNPYTQAVLSVGLTPERARQIWIDGTLTDWGDWVGVDGVERINVYTRSDAAGAAEMWARFAGGQAQEELQGIAVNGDPGLAEAVRQDRFGIGYNNIGFAYDPATGRPLAGLRIIPVDLNRDGIIQPDEEFYGAKDDIVEAISRRVYPFPPARELYLVTKGEPDPDVKAFYRWILTDGQAYVHAAGYVPLTPERLADALVGLE